MRTKPPSNRIFEPKSREEIQELTREAAEAQDQILNILRSIKEGQQSLIKKLAKDLGIPGEHDTIGLSGMQLFCMPMRNYETRTALSRELRASAFLQLSV